MFTNVYWLNKRDLKLNLFLNISVLLTIKWLLRNNKNNKWSSPRSFSYLYTQFIKDKFGSKLKKEKIL